MTPIFIFFFFNDTATTEIYTLSLHDALPIYTRRRWAACTSCTTIRRDSTRPQRPGRTPPGSGSDRWGGRSEEHTSELHSLAYLVCRLLLEKKKNDVWIITSYIHEMSNSTLTQ